LRQVDNQVTGTAAQVCCLPRLLYGDGVPTAQGNAALTRPTSPMVTAKSIITPR
jgi:hypothetical protein